MISVIMPTYGRTADIVLRAVGSIVRQTYTDWELYVVDDNKRNNPYSEAVKNALESLNDTRIHYLRMEKNSGACAARNKGIQVSKGEYVAFLDDDDEWLPERLEKQLPALEDDNIGFTYCGVWILNEMTGKKKSSLIQFKHGNVYYDLLKGNFMGGVSNFIVKRSAMEKCGAFREDMPSSQDYELWIRLSKQYDVSSIAENLSILHIHEGDSITRSLDRRIAGFRKVLETYYEDIVKDKKTHSFQLYNLGKWLVLNKETKEGVHYLWQAVKLMPFNALYYVAVIMYWKVFG